MLLPLFAAAAAAAIHPTAPARLSDTVRVLASDRFEGRAPGTIGEARTIEYLIARLKALGVEPAGPDGGWTQIVPVIRNPVGDGALKVRSPSGSLTLEQGHDIYVSTVQPSDRIDIAAAPMVFVGYGVRAPERGWDDFKGADLKGKVAIFLVNDPISQPRRATTPRASSVASG